MEVLRRFLQAHPLDRSGPHRHNVAPFYRRIPPPALLTFFTLRTGPMAENIIQQVQDIEAEADGIVADARENAREMERSTEEQIANLREERQQQLERDVAEMENELQEQSRRRIEEIEKKAHQAERELDSLGDETMGEAVEFIVSHLREED